MLRRISAAIGAGRRAALAPKPRLATAAGAVQPAWALVHFGDPAAVSDRLAVHRAFCSGRGLRCLVLSDAIPPVCIGSHDILFEFLPWPAKTALSTPGGPAAAADHSFRRLSHILTFWQVVGCDWAGARALALKESAPIWAHPVVRAGQAAKGNPSHVPTPVLP